MPDEPPRAHARQYRWPWLVLAALLLAILLMVLWMIGAVNKVKQIKESTGQAAGVARPLTPTLSRSGGEGDRSWTNGMVWIAGGTLDRKSTRLNSSHTVTS